MLTNKTKLFSYVAMKLLPSSFTAKKLGLNFVRIFCKKRAKHYLLFLIGKVFYGFIET